MSQWNKFREFVNKSPIGSIITRQEVLFYVYENRGQWKGYSRQTTVDGYRLILDRLGIVIKYKRGQYRVMHHVREDVTLETLKRLAYPKRGWQEWFIPASDRRKRVIKCIKSYSPNISKNEEQI